LRRAVNQRVAYFEVTDITADEFDRLLRAHARH